jgi:NADPH:quinone reductase-like Zn-dependent oxidoreductase
MEEEYSLQKILSNKMLSSVGKRGAPMTVQREAGSAVARTMRAVRLHSDRGVEGLALEEIETPRLVAGEALVRVHAAAITRDELDWPTRLPATPSYEFSGVVAAIASDESADSVGEPVFGLTHFDRHGAAADYVAVPANVLAPKPRTLGHVQSAAVPLAALSAWQGLFEHGGLEAGQRVLVLGAAGGVGHFATQLAHVRGAQVIGVASSTRLEDVRKLGADEALDDSRFDLESAVGQVDLVFDTGGGELLASASALVRPGGRIVSVAEQPPGARPGSRIEGVYFVVEPNREQLVELAALVDSDDVRPAIDSVFPLADARTAFERTMARGKSGKVVLRVVDDEH